MATGNRIREIRESRNMSAEQLARKIGVAKTTITRYETGDIEKMPYLNFLKILIALETTPEEILPEEELELVEKSDELRGLYKVMGEMQKGLVDDLSKLPPEDAEIVRGLAQGLLERRK